ncbi:MAG: hypothetical protein D6753_05520 [Planctomycetota bacterium]|nr:MAG: hypothetical protein D6753_05520 [Planctomycetota bacterium]
MVVVCAVNGCRPKTATRPLALPAASSPSTDGRAVAADGGLFSRIDQELRLGQQRRMSSDRNAAWQIMHGVICYGSDLQIETPDAGTVGALSYMLGGGSVRGFELQPGDLLPDGSMRGVKARLEPGSYEGQGHVDQWIAILAMAGVPRETPIRIGDEMATVEAFARQAQYDVSRNVLDEYSWTLIALTHYFPDQPRWTAWGDYAVSWEDLVAQELEKDLDSSPCGGTHRMAGIVAALRARQRLGLPDSPVWDRAAERVDRLLAHVESTRLADGTLSAYYFAKPGRTNDLGAQLAGSGHVFEFCALALPDERLTEAWVQMAARRICDLLEATRDQDLDCGALYHALHGLKVYRQRLARISPAT